MSTSAEQILADALGVKETMDVMIKQNAVYVCMICGTTTPHFNRVCKGCEDPNGGDNGYDE